MLPLCCRSGYVAALCVHSLKFIRQSVFCRRLIHSRHKRTRTFGSPCEPRWSIHQTAALPACAMHGPSTTCSLPSLLKDLRILEKGQVHPRGVGVACQEQHGVVQRIRLFHLCNRRWKRSAVPAIPYQTTGSITRISDSHHSFHFAI